MLQWALLVSTRADLDTAPLYGAGESERITGLALSGGFREKVTLATKCGDPMPEYVRGEKPYSRQGLLNSVEHSLKLLNTKTIDVLLIHDPYKDELEQAIAPGGLMEGMRELKHQGASSVHCRCTRRLLSELIVSTDAERNIVTQESSSTLASLCGRMSRSNSSWRKQTATWCRLLTTTVCSV